ncbi:23381_t:CDS:2 [Gigaspora margarita]|uniref:23381_t:CDS:1 n=1 Tax=Gigaspora margarita TaxID=4874 RepID=A0ABN7UR64_GIGMA|nr:23381_t:CDS:2 [Gigaspora margarita]
MNINANDSGNKLNEDSESPLTFFESYAQILQYLIKEFEM